MLLSLSSFSVVVLVFMGCFTLLSRLHFSCIRSSVAVCSWLDLSGFWRFARCVGCIPVSPFAKEAMGIRLNRERLCWIVEEKAELFDLGQGLQLSPYQSPSGRCCFVNLFSCRFLLEVEATLALSHSLVEKTA